MKVAENKEISSAIVRRLPRYYRYLTELLEKGVVRISSNELSEKVGVTASQIRQDFNKFGGFGRQGYGYNVSSLRNEIGSIIGLDREYNVVVIGAGNIGQAITKYTDFESKGFYIGALFDINPIVVGSVVRGKEVMNIGKLEGYIKENDVDIVVLATSTNKANEIAQRVVELGVKAIWNFVPTDLELPEDVVCENVHLEESLMRLSYKMNNSVKKDV